MIPNIAASSGVGGGDQVSGRGGSLTFGGGSRSNDVSTNTILIGAVLIVVAFIAGGK